MMPWSFSRSLGRRRREASLAPAVVPDSHVTQITVPGLLECGRRCLASLATEAPDADLGRLVGEEILDAAHEVGIGRESVGTLASGWGSNRD